MTYQIRKDPRSKIQDPRSRQRGVTLLLAILLLASILAISFSLASVLFVEVRSSSDLTKTEGAFYAANGVSEQALFNLKRQVPSGDCGGSCYITQFNNSATLDPNQGIVTSSTSTPLFTDKIPASTFASTKNVYNFCDVSQGSNGCGYGKVTVTYLSDSGSNDSVYAYLCQWNPNEQVIPGGGGAGTYDNLPCSNQNDPQSGGSDSYWVSGSCGSQQMTATTCTSESWTLSSNLQQELILYNSGGTGGNVYVSIETYGADGVTPEGLPYVGETSVTANAVNGDVGRKIQVVVPNNASSAGTSTSIAVTPFITSVTSFSYVRNDYSGWVGMGITVGSSPISVQSLGRIMVAGNSGTHTVKIVQASTQSDIASVSVNMAGGTAGSFVYQNLGASVTLNANTSYYILSSETSGGDQWYDYGSNLQTTGAASDNLSVYGSAAPYATFSTSDQGYVPVNFEYQTSSSPTTGTITLVKNTTGGDGSFSFTTTGGSNLPANINLSTSGGTASQTYSSMATGNYSISESVPSGWSLASATCSDGTNSYPASAFTLAAGATMTCTFTDNKSSGIARVQSNHLYPMGGSQALSFNSATKNGDFIVAEASWYPSISQPSCSDTQNDSFTNMPLFSASGATVFVCYASNISGGSDTVTMSGLSGANDPGMNVMEYSGIASGNPLDFTSFLDGSSGGAVTNPTSHNFTSNSTDLLLAIFADETVIQSSITAGSNYSLIQADNGHIDAEEDWLNASPQTTSASFNLSNASNSWGITVIGFKAP